ncbi:circularly permuted type 2 ATP-grasp protein [Aliarcobacter butzleri]|uniref:circularly permuted type 2 ATP-grasp protein n=1 Tax=Aliarcobacter butzleri TaxID=28197 RepID=UPI0021B187D0|nr:circularly permuted type 2 ATP-grasp protein [Aliarcobacter butzleri]MCT7613748.1 circularly permuted type 2 ATP-grasp protein [Aliarcobacter butzleri]MCT7622727.1 circularly permuted type 2 ATP-grasp protein [Aliarcobacter butzleri]MCT7642338.1 circularly permuted type 2 ATP-grasp protein [Aliarcobacter butzleri]
MLEIKNEKRELFWEIFSKQNRLLIDEFQKYMDKFAVNFNLYKDGNFIERSLPFDVIPRIIDSKEFDKIDKGLSQRIKALNLFLEDLYTQKKIIKDKVIPEEFIFQAKGYLKELNGFSPNKKIRTHINGIDLVKDTITNDWVIVVKRSAKLGS